MTDYMHVAHVGLGGTAGTFANGHVGSLQFLTWPKPASEVYSTQQQQQQQQQHQPEQQSVSQQHQARVPHYLASVCCTIV